MKKSYLLVSLIVLFLTLSLVQAVPDFTFIQISDTHAPQLESQKTISTIKGMKQIELKPYNIMSQPPAFITNTGDLTEFGEEGWAAYLDFWKDNKLPRYEVMGNHDETWGALRDKMWERYHAPYYSIDTFDCHFIFLESPMIQNPLPAFGQDEINWLKKDLSRLSHETPIFIFFHHPLDSSEYISDYEHLRLLELFQPYNLSCIFVGHGHSAHHYNFEGYDGVEGGSGGVKGNPGNGYNIITISNDTLYIAYRIGSDSSANYPMLQKPLKKARNYPTINISGLSDDAPITKPIIPFITQMYNFPGSISKAEYRIDEEGYSELTNTGEQFEGTINTEKLDNGIHYLKVQFTGSEMNAYRTQVFWTEKPGLAKAKWRINLPAAIYSSPAQDNEKLYFGSNDGTFYAVSKKDGKILWTFKTGAEIISQPIYNNDHIYFGSGDKYFYCLDNKGNMKWRFLSDSPIYSSPCMNNGILFLGTKKGNVFALRAEDGTLKWENRNPGYCIPSWITQANGTIYLTSWDCFVYAIDEETGKLKWKSMAAGSATEKAAKKYYSAAISPVRAIGNSLYVSDRDWYFSRMDATNGTLSSYTGNSLAIALSEKQDAIYKRLYRGAGGHLQKLTPEGAVIWTSPVMLNSTQNGRYTRYPVPPYEKDNKVYAVSCWGTLNCIDSDNGNILWNYQVSPQLPVVSIPAVDDSGTAYVTATDGSVTAVKTLPTN